MMRSFSTPNEDTSEVEVLPNHNACVIHFVHTLNLNLTFQYLISAWKAGSLSANNHYLVSNTKPAYDREILTLSEIFDFQRLFLISTKVKKY